MIKAEQLELPLLQTIQEMGGSSSPQEIYPVLANKLNIPEYERNEPVEGYPSHKK